MNISDRELIEQWEALCSMSTFLSAECNYDENEVFIEDVDCKYDSDQVLARTIYDADTFILDGEMLEAWVDELFKMPGYPELNTCGFSRLVIVYPVENDSVSVDLAKALFKLDVNLCDIEIVEWNSKRLFDLTNSKCSYAISIESLLDGRSGKFIVHEIEYTYDLFKALGDIK